MTLDEAKKVAATFRGNGEIPEAFTALLDALRLAEQQALDVREAAARVADAVGDNTGDAIAEVIRALPLPAPVAPARTYEDGVRDAVKAVRSVETKIVHRRQEPITETDVLRIVDSRAAACATAVEALLATSPATVTTIGTDGTPWTSPVDHAPKTVERVRGRDDYPSIANRFDAEAAFVALAEIGTLRDEIAWQGGTIDTALAMLTGDSTRKDVIEFLRLERGTDRTPTANDLRARIDALTAQVADLESRAIPKAWVERATTDFMLRGVTATGDVAMIRGREGAFRLIDFGTDEIPREFPTLSDALAAAAAKETP